MYKVHFPNSYDTVRPIVMKFFISLIVKQRLPGQIINIRLKRLDSMSLSVIFIDYNFLFNFRRFQFREYMCSVVQNFRAISVNLILTTMTVNCQFVFCVVLFGVVAKLNIYNQVFRYKSFICYIFGVSHFYYFISIIIGKTHNEEKL